MPTVTLETGQKLNFPEGTTSDQIHFAVDEFITKNNVVKQEVAQAPQEEQSAQPETFQQGNVRRAGQFAQGIPQGLGNAAIGGFQAATDIGESASRMIEKLYFGDTMQMNTFGNRLADQVKQRKEEQAQLPTSERVGIFAGETAPFLTAGVGTGAKVAAATGSKIAGLAAGGAVGGATINALAPQEEAGLENRAGETVKGAATGAVTGAAIGGVTEAAKVAGKGLANLGKDIIAGYKARPVEAIAGFTNKPVQTLDAVASNIKEKSSVIYKAMQESNSTLTPKATKEVFTGIDSALSDSGIMNKRLHGDTLGIISDLKKLAKEKSGNISIEELDQYRQLLGDVVKRNTDVAGKLNADGLKANIAINKLDDVVENLKPELITGGKGAVNLLNQARTEWGRYRKFDAITNIVKKADGDPNRLKTLMQNFVNNPKNLRGFNSVEREGLKKASRNTTSEGLLKAVGKFGFDLGSGRNSGNTALPVIAAFGGGAVGGGATAGTSIVVGTLARQAQKLSARGKVDQVLRLIEGQNPEVATKLIQTLTPKTRNFVLINLLSKNAANSNNDAQAASTDNLTEEQIRAQLIDANNQNMKQGLPQAYTAEEIKNNPSLIKKRYYR
jgi:hypothetical protein